jgi:hypothetical protein
MKRTLALVVVAVAGCTSAVESGAQDLDGALSDPPDAGPVLDAQVCASVKIGTKPVTPTVELLVDESGSMGSTFGNTTRFAAIYDTLMDPTTGVVKQLQGQVRFGLDLYTSDNGSLNGAACPLITTVPIALNNYAAIDAVYSQASPQQDTPTGESVVVATNQLKAVTAPGPKIIVLATDGEPDTCAVPNPKTGQGVAIKAAQDAHTAGIDLYIIGVSSDVGKQNLQDMANAGVGLAVGGAQNAPYYQAFQPQDVVNAFHTIIGGVLSCSFTMDGQIDPALAGRGAVTVDGHPVTFGTDWKVDPDGKTLELLGAACATVKSGGTHDVHAEFPCGVLIQ